MASDLSNNTTIRRSASVEQAYAYAGVGTGGMMANVFILAVLLSDRKFLKQSANIAGIAVSHLLCALAIGATGYYRVVNHAILSQNATAWSCVARLYPAMFPFAFQSIGVMLTLVGVERFSVFVFPNWYRIKWTNARSWQMVGIGYVFVSVSFLVGLYQAWEAPTATLNCGYSSVFGDDYIVYSTVISASGGAIAAGLTLLGLIKGSRRARNIPSLSGEAGRYKRQLKLTRSMLSVAICDFCLVVIPNIFYIIETIDGHVIPGNLSNFMNVTYCVNTVMSLGMYLAFHKQFRASAVKLLPFKKQVQVSPVSPLAKETRAF